jgi:hypothetical protein
MSAEKTGCWLDVIPVLVFDCVALRLKEGKNGLFSECMDTCLSCTLNAVWTAPVKCCDLENVDFCFFLLKRRLFAI